MKISSLKRYVETNQPKNKLENIMKCCELKKECVKKSKGRIPHFQVNSKKSKLTMSFLKENSAVEKSNKKIQMMSTKRK